MNQPDKDSNHPLHHRRRRRNLIVIAIVLTLLGGSLGTAFYGKRVYRHFFPRPEVPCCVKTPSAPCCVKDTLPPEGERLALRYLGFDAARFQRQSDSLLTSIAHAPIHLTCNISSEPKTSGRKYTFEFYPGRENSSLRFWVSISLYREPGGLESDFKTLQQDSKNEFGLTYAFDDVWKTTNKIVWLHVGCSYAGYNKDRLRQFVLDCVEMDTVTGTIDCACGDDCGG